jgi:hypothetical protein
MKITTISGSLGKRKGFVLMILALIFVSYAGRYFAQRRDTKQVSPEVEIKVLSAVATRFEKPIRIGPPRRAVEYQEAKWIGTHLIHCPPIWNLSFTLERMNITSSPSIDRISGGLWFLLFISGTGRN